MHYLLIYELVPDYVNRRAPLRADHLRHAWAVERPRRDGARRHPHRARSIAPCSCSRAIRPTRRGVSPEQDPYVLNGLVTRWEVRQWVTVAGDHPATPVRPEDIA